MIPVMTLLNFAKFHAKQIIFSDRSSSLAVGLNFQILQGCVAT